MTRPRARRCWAATAALIASLIACATHSIPGGYSVPGGHSVPGGRPASPPGARAEPPAPKYPPFSAPLSRESAHLRRAASPDFWALAPHYVGQRDDVSCSLASLTMLVNAARNHTPLASEQPLVSQTSLRQRVNSPIWERGLAPGGEGVTLHQLALLAAQSLRAFGLAPSRVEVTHVPEASADALARWREALRANEASEDDWLLVNFYAAAYVGVGDYGHIAPVGAYDADTQRVLVLDPDRTWYEPYWLPDDVALAGMATRDSVTGEPRGYLYVSIER